MSRPRLGSWPDTVSHRLRTLTLRLRVLAVSLFGTVRHATISAVAGEMGWGSVGGCGFGGLGVLVLLWVRHRGVVGSVVRGLLLSPVVVSERICLYGLCCVFSTYGTCFCA